MEGSEISCRCDSPRREDKTQITHLEQGVDFLGVTTRGKPNGKLLTKLSNDDALRRIRRRLSASTSGPASHPNKPTPWVIARYFGMFNPARQDEWVFRNRATGFHLRKFAWTPIIRHRMVAATAFPDDPSLTDYWTRRRRRQPPPARHGHATTPRSPSRPLPALPRAAATCRPQSANPTQVGTMVRHPHGDRQTLDHRLGNRDPG